MDRAPPLSGRRSAWPQMDQLRPSHRLMRLCVLAALAVLCRADAQLGHTAGRELEREQASDTLSRQGLEAKLLAGTTGVSRARRLQDQVVDRTEGQPSCTTPVRVVYPEDLDTLSGAGGAVGSTCTTATGITHAAPSGCAALNSYSSIAYAWSIKTAPGYGPQRIVVTTCGLTTQDTVLTVREGCTPTGIAVACNDNVNSADIPCYSQSGVVFIADPGTVYTVYVQLWGFYSSTCWFSPSVVFQSKSYGSPGFSPAPVTSPVSAFSPPLPSPPRPSPPAPILTPSPITPSSPPANACSLPPTLITADSNMTLTAAPGTSVGGQCDVQDGVLHTPPCADVRSTYAYTWPIQSTVAQTIVVETCSTAGSYDTVLTVRGGCSPTNITFTPVCNDDGGATCGDSASRLNFTAQPGVVYTVYLNLYSGTDCWNEPSVIITSSTSPALSSPAPFPASPTPTPGPTTSPVLGPTTSPAPGPTTSPAPGPATSPAPGPTTSPAPGTNISSTITYGMSMTGTSRLGSDNTLLQAFGSDLATATAAYFSVPLSAVQITLASSGGRRSLQQSGGGTLVQPSTRIVTTWAASDVATPAALTAKLQALKVAPATVVPASMRTTYSIDPASVSLAQQPVADGPLAIPFPPTPDPTPAPSPSPSPSDSKSGLSTGAIIGIAAGAGGAVVILAAVLGTWLWRRKKGKQAPKAAPPHLTSNKLADDKHVQMATGGSSMMPSSPQSPDQGCAVAVIHTMGSAGGPYTATNTGASGDRAHVTGGQPLPSEASYAQANAAQAAPGFEAQRTASEVPSSEGLIIAWSSVNLTGVLGAGSLGQVFKGEWQHSGVAVKMLGLGGPDPAAQRRAVTYVTSTMRELHHPCIARIYGLVDEAPNFAVVMQLYPRGSLAAYMATPEYARVPLKTKLRWAVQVADALSFLHTRKPAPLLHLDLKPSNILLGEESQGQGHRLGVADVGLAACMGVAPNLNSAAITPPEVWKEPYAPRTSPAIDVFAYGTLLWEIMMGQRAFHGVPLEGIKSLVCEGRRPAVPDHLPPAVSSLILDCWRDDPANRPPFNTIVGRVLSALTDLEPTQNMADLTATLTTIHGQY